MPCATARVCGRRQKRARCLNQTPGSSATQIRSAERLSDNLSHPDWFQSESRTWSHCVARPLSNQPSTHLPWRVLRRQVYRYQDRRCTFICSTIIEHRKAYAAIRCLPSADKSSTMELHSLPVISPPTRSAMIFLRAQPSRSKL
jgi:hypothetical protein